MSFSSTYFPSTEDMNVPSVSPISPVSDWAMLKTPMGNMPYPEGVPMPDFKMSPLSYAPVDCGPGYFALQVPPVQPVPAGFSTFDFVYQRAALPPQPPVLSPGTSASPRTVSHMSSMPTPPLVDGVTTPTPLKAEASETQITETKTKPQGTKRKHSMTPSEVEPLAPTKPQPHLRTAKRVSQAPVAGARIGKGMGLSSPTDELDSDVKARAAHNQVEQQYRQRLNAHFERLLAVLPLGDGNDETGELCSSNTEPERRKVSKAEVLDLARRRIEALEWRVRRLETGRELELGESD